MFHVSAFLFWCWLCFWYVLFCSCLVFVLFLVLLSQTMKKNTVFPVIVVYFSHVACKVVLYFSVSGFGSCCFFVSCVVCFHFRHLICIVLWLCCLVFSLTKTGLSGFVVCILHLVVFFPFCCFVLNFVFFLFFHSSKKDPQKTGHSKNPKKQKIRKKGQTKKNS